MNPYGDDRTMPSATGVPSAGPTPGWAPPPPPPKRTPNYLWIVVAATVVIVVVCVTLVVVTTRGDDSTDDVASTADSSSSSSSSTKASVTRSTPRAPAPPPTSAAPPPPPTTPVDPNALEGLLITGEEAGTRFGDLPLKDSGSGTEPIGGDSLIPLDCRSVWAPIHQETYDGSGYTAIYRQSMKGDAPEDPGLVEAVIAFPDNQAAQAAMDRVVTAWRACQALDFTEQYRGAPVEFTTGDVVVLDGIASLPVSSKTRLASPETSKDPNCQRAIGVSRNVVVDLLACSPFVGSTGSKIATDVIAKINAAP